MKTLALRVATAALAIALTAGLSVAQADTKKRKVGFFESLFGSSSNSKPRVKKRKSAFGNQWWEDDSDIRIIRNSEADIAVVKKRRNQVDSDDDPEGDPGLGMGNLTYVPDKLVPLGGMTLDEPRPEAADAAALYDALADKTLDIRVLAEARDAIANHYRANGFRPLWTTDGKVTARAVQVLKLLAAADAEGLVAADYLPPVLSGFDAVPSEGDMAALARLDLGLTAVVLKYARHASGGQFDPRRLSRYNDVTPQWVKAADALKVLAWSPFPSEYLQGLHPRHPAYAAFRHALAEKRARGEGETLVPIPDGKLIKVGNSDDRLPDIRARLAARGFAPAPDVIEDDPLVLDAELSARIKAFQASAGLDSDGLIGRKTIGALNGNDDTKDVARLIDNMERLRWLPRDLGRRHVFVNQPAFSVRVMDGDQEIWRSRVIVGRPMTQTAAFHDEIETVVFNPSWGVPQSIIANEYLPKLRSDPSYLDRIGFKVVDARGKTVRSSAVDWWSYGSKVPFGIQQPPGRSNALGELKFLFPNSHDIYMHDTPNRELFDNERRAFSHGCVRVQNPREFASVLLGWNAEEVDRNVDGRKSQSVKLAAKVPVHLTYFTAWPDESGKITYFADIYGRDQAMDNARSAITLARR